MLELSHEILLYSLELSCMVSCDVSGERKSLNSAQLTFPDWWGLCTGGACCWLLEAASCEKRSTPAANACSF